MLSGAGSLDRMLADNDRALARLREALARLREALAFSSAPPLPDAPAARWPI